MASFFFFFLLSLLLLNAAAAAAATYTLPLSPITAIDRHDLFQNLKFQASLSITRARHLKRPGNNFTFSPNSDSELPILPQSYGGYSVSLSFGTPPQSVDLIMDTGSSLVWLPCTKHYTCSKCNFKNLNPTKTPVFVPKLSSSVKIIGCSNPKCAFIDRSDVVSICKKCTGNCTQICPPYMIAYGAGSTSGLLMSDTLHLPGKKAVDGFVAGCSMFSTNQPSGIAGFGRRPESLPVQMGLTRFSYCLVSHRFDDTAKGSEMVIVSGSGSSKTRNVSYTPFITNSMASMSNPVFLNYYYIGLKKITVGGRKVKIPHRLLTLGKDGNGGTIIDSGSTFTFMEHEIYAAVAAEFEKRMGNYRRAAAVEKWSGLSPCFEIADEESVSFPELVFYFKGGAEMELPLADYFSVVSEDGAVCMTIVTEQISPAGIGGPAIILGNYQQQNFYVEYDLENQRLGFRKQTC